MIICGTFRIRIEKCKRAKQTLGTRVDSKSIDQQIEIYSSIVSKIEAANPGLDSFDKKLEQLCQDPDFLKAVD
jgi:hypothetical protein